MTKEFEPHPIDIEVGRRLREVRTTRGMSQKALGEAGGVSFQMVQKYERGHNRLSASMICLFAQALGVNVQDLLPAAYTSGASSGWAESKEARLILMLVNEMPANRRGTALKIIQALAKEAEDGR